MLPERALAQMVSSVLTGWDLPKEKRYLASAPISHAAGMLITPVLLSGGTVVLHRAFDPARWLSTVADERITVGLLVPTMIYAVLDHADLDRTNLASLETIMYGASAISPTRLAEGIRRLGPVFCQLYGQTECAGITTSLWRAQHLPEDLHRLTSCGMPMPGVRVAVLDDEGQPVADGTTGEICVQGASVMQGYWKQPELTAGALDGGWLRTGDMAVRDEAGFLYIVDRKKEMIVSGGFNVFPREIEDVLSAHPAVAVAAVIGVPDDKWGEAVKALVVAKPGASVDPAELIAPRARAQGAGVRAEVRRPGRHAAAHAGGQARQEGAARPVLGRPRPSGQLTGRDLHQDGLPRPSGAEDLRRPRVSEPRDRRDLAITDQDQGALGHHEVALHIPAYRAPCRPRPTEAATAYPSPGTAPARRRGAPRLAGDCLSAAPASRGRSGIAPSKGACGGRRPAPAPGGSGRWPSRGRGARRSHRIGAACRPRRRVHRAPAHASGLASRSRGHPRSARRGRTPRRGT